MTTLTPTAEQTAALELFTTGASLVIEAGAGTGKTSTLRMLAASTSRRGLYVAFNRAIVDDSARSMPRNVTSSTAHSLAYRAVGGDYRHRMGGARMKSADIARMLKIDPIMITAPSGPKRMAPGYLASHVTRAVSLFCQSAEDAPTIRHFPYIEGIDAMGPDGRRGFTNNNTIARSLLPHLHKAWADVNSTNGDLPFKHEHYLKIWQLSRPVLPFDFIMFDEAQDASPVMASIIEDQANYGAQLVFVGDSQQAIYGFTGAVNALEELATPNRTMLSKSFRFGGEIAGVANKVLAALSSPLRIEGAGRPGTVRTDQETPARPGDVILCRTNATCVRRALMEIAEGGMPAIVGGADEVVRFAQAAEQIRTEGWTPHPELSCFKTWGEVQDYVDEDPEGGDLALLVNLVDEFGADVIIHTLGQSVPEDRATLVVSTAHKAKGREWDSVHLADDFPTGFNRDGLPIGCPPEELRLLYVAVTRARLHLDTGGNPLLGGSTKIVILEAPGMVPATSVDRPFTDPETLERVTIPGTRPVDDPTVAAIDVMHAQTVEIVSDRTGETVRVVLDIIAPQPDEDTVKLCGKTADGDRHMATLARSDRVLVVAIGRPKRAGSSDPGVGR